MVSSLFHFVGLLPSKLSSPSWVVGIRYVRLISWLTILSVVLWVLWGVEDDAQHGSLVQILFVHVPAAWGALACYTLMACASAFGLIYRSFVGLKIAHAFAWPGCVYAILSVLTGMLWGKPAWGTWWVWDARLTSMLILSFFYGSYLHFAYDRKTLTTAGLVAVIGWINIPIIKGSVNWWATLHQKPSVSLLGGSTLDSYYAWPLALMTLAWIVFTFAWALRWLQQELARLKQFS